MIVEDGNFVPGANSYVSVAYADQYFTDRPNSGWTADVPELAPKNGALIAATDYIEKKYSHRFLGTKFFISNKQARNVLTFLTSTASGLTITIGATTAEVGVDIALGSSFSELLSNVIDFFNDADVGITAEAGFDTSIVFTYDDEGIDGNYITCTSSDTDIATFALTAMSGGSSVGQPQRLSFPRKYLIDRYGATIYGVPEQLKMAVCEYAVRATTAVLLPDPTLSETGMPVQRVMEKIGPIETETEYQVVMSNLLQSYPAADRLLIDLISSGGGVYR